MRVANWNPNAIDQEFGWVANERLVAAANIVAETARRNLRGHIGTGKTTGISRPAYKKGMYAGEEWTGRTFGSLLKSIRVRTKRDKRGHELWRRKNVRVYAGNFLVYYASIFEFTKSFMRTALNESLPEVQRILGVASGGGGWSDSGAPSQQGSWLQTITKHYSDPTRNARLDAFEASLRKG